MLVKGQLKDAQLELKDNQDPTKTGQPVFDISTNRVKIFNGTNTKSLANTDDKTPVDELVNDDGTTAIGSGLPGQALKRKLDDTGWEFGEVAANVDFIKDQFVGDGSTTAFTLSRSPGNSQNVDVYLQGFYQESSTYSISGAILTFVTAPQSTFTIEVKSGATGTIAEPADDTVTTDKIVDSAVTTAKLDDNSVTLAKAAPDLENRLLSPQAGRVFEGGFNGDIVTSSSSAQVLTMSGTDTTHVVLEPTLFNKLTIQTAGLYILEASVTTTDINTTTSSLNAHLDLKVEGSSVGFDEFDLGVFGSGNLSFTAVPTLKTQKTMELEVGDEITVEFRQQNANGGTSVQVIPSKSNLTVARVGG